MTEVASTPSLALAGLRVLLMLLAIGGAAAAWLWWQRRSPRGARRIEVQDRLFLGRGSSVVLLQVDEQRLLVGVTPEGTRLLRSLPPRVLHEPSRGSDSPRSQRFAKLLSLGEEAE